MAALDDIDRNLIAALRHDSRRTVSDLAATLGIARATVRARLDRLEREKVILGYTIVVKGDIEAAPVRGVMSIELEGRSQEGVVKALSGMRKSRPFIRPTAAGT